MAKILISRPLPEAVVAALRRRMRSRCGPRRRPMRRDEMVAALTGFDAVLPTLGDAFSAGVFASRRKIRAAGCWPISASATTTSTLPRRRPGCRGDQHARRAHRCHRRPRADADPDDRPARRRGRAAGAVRRLDRLAPDPAPRPLGQRQDGGHRRHGPDRPGDRPALPFRLRDGGGVLQPLAEDRPPSRPGRPTGSTSLPPPPTSWWSRCRAGPRRIT